MGSPSHGAHCLFMEAQRNPLSGDKHDLIRARGKKRGHQPIPLVQLDGDDAAGLRVCELRDCHLLHHTLPRGHENEHLVGEIAQVDDSGDLLFAAK